MIYALGLILFSYLALKECRRINNAEKEPPKWKVIFGATILLVTWIIPTAVVMQIAEFFDYENSKYIAYTSLFVSVIFLVFSINYVSPKKHD